MMSIFTNVILPFLLAYKYLAIFIVTFLAAAIIPIPPGTMIMASSALAYEGYFRLEFVIGFAILGKIVGDSLAYFLAHHYGYKALSKIGLKKLLDSSRYKSVERKIKSKPALILFFSRFEISINLIVNFISGMGKVPYGKFLLFTTLGEITQILVYSSLGYFFGGSIKLVSSIIGSGSLTLLVILAIIYFWYKRRKNKTQS